MIADILCQVGAEALEVNLLKAMRNELEVRGWWQGNMKRPGSKEVCLLGAAKAAVGEYNATKIAKNPIEEVSSYIEFLLRPYIKESISGKYSLWTAEWNDSPQRTYGDIKNLLDKAIADRGGFV